MLLTFCALLLAQAAPSDAPPSGIPGMAQVQGIPSLLQSGVPEVPRALRARLGQYQNARAAALLDVMPDGSAALISTRFASTAQLHLVEHPMGARQQLTFGEEPISSGKLAPDGRSVYYLRDVGGGEFFQVYRLDRRSGRSELLTDGKSRHEGLILSHDGKQIAWASTARNGKDHDIYAGSTADPKKVRRLTEREGSWEPVDFSRDGKRLLVVQERAVDDSDLHVVDLATGEMRQITPKEGKGSRADANGRRVDRLEDERAGPLDEERGRRARHRRFRGSRAGPLPGKGWRLRARLPLEAPQRRARACRHPLARWTRGAVEADVRSRPAVPRQRDGLRGPRAQRPGVDGLRQEVRGDGQRPATRGGADRHRRDARLHRFAARSRQGPRSGVGRLLRRIHGAREPRLLRRAHPGGGRRGRHLESGQLPQEHAGLPPGSPARGVRRRARPGGAGGAGAHLALEQRRQDPQLAVRRARSQRPARAAERVGADREGGTSARQGRLVPARRQRGPRFQEEGKPRLLLGRDDVVPRAGAEAEGRAAGLDRLEKLRVRPVLVERLDEPLHRLDRLERVERAAEFLHLLVLVLREELLLLAGAALLDVDGRKDALLGERAVEVDLAVARALELLEDHLVHPRPGVDERGGEDGQRSSLFRVPGSAEEALGALEGARIDATR